MATKRKRSVKRQNNFYEVIGASANRSLAIPAVADHAKNVSKLVTVALAAAILVIAITARSTVLVSTPEVTPAGSIGITGANLADVKLQNAQTVESYQSTRSDLQVQDGSKLQAYSDSANLQGGIPTQQ